MWLIRRGAVVGHVPRQWSKLFLIYLTNFLLMTTLSELKLACISLPVVFHLCANAPYILGHVEFSVHSMHVAVCLLKYGY